MRDIKKSVHDQFGRVAERYKTSHVHATGHDLQQIASLVQQTDHPYVLDVGCGAGHTSIAVAPYSQQVVAFDLTPQMLEQVEQFAHEKNLSNIRTRQGDVEQLPFEEATFDIVVSRYSAHHWPHPRVAVSECRRVLKPGGQFILSDVIAPESPAQDSFLQTIELIRDPSHVRDHTISQWQAMLIEAGFQPSVISTWHIPLDLESWTLRMATPDLNLKMLDLLLEIVTEDIKETFHITAQKQFVIEGALFKAI